MSRETIVNPHDGGDLFGAFRALQGIKHNVSILNGALGCSHYISWILGTHDVGTGISANSGVMIQTAGFTQKEVIFGGEEILRERITRIWKRYKPDLITIINGYIPNIIGDDVEQTISELEEKTTSELVLINLSGYEGDCCYGFNRAMIAVLDKLALKSKGKNNKQINLIGLFPDDYKSREDIEELKRILAAIGIKINCVISHDLSIESIKNVADAVLNVVCSDCFEETARFLENRFDIPYTVCLPPYGLTLSSTWTAEIAKELNLNEKAKKIIDQELRRTTDRLGRGSWTLEKLDGLPFVLIGDPFRVAGIAFFLKEELQMSPQLIATNCGGERGKKYVLQVNKNIAESKILVEPDIYNIESSLKRIWHPSLFFFGSYTLHMPLVKKYRIQNLINIVYPCIRPHFNTEPYMGFRGFLNLTCKVAERLYS